MEKRTDVLREALEENAKEVTRWEQYCEENKTAVENLVTFSKLLEVDVMVPIGRKAYMPGRLVHTNEVLVGHYQGYFSKCSAYKAKEICEHRIKMAQEHLKRLQTEEELWQNKLEKPYTEGVLPTEVEREIIEDYDEEREKSWREKHKLRLKKQKLREKQQRENMEDNKAVTAKEKSDEDILKTFEEAELMEELEEELNLLEIDEISDETIRKLMSGEIQLPEQKRRTAHDSTTMKQAKNKEEEIKKTDGNLKGVVKKKEMNMSIPSTNNNCRPNPELLLHSSAEDSNDDDDESMAEEVKLIKRQAKFLPPTDQIGFYEYQIQIVKQRILTLPLTNDEQIDEKINLLYVLENLEELLETAEVLAEEEEGEKSLEQENLNTAENVEIEEVSKQTASTKQKPSEKRRISFALEDQTLEFRKNERVTQMLPPKIDTSIQRDIIKLNESILPVDLPKTVTLNKKLSILEKVEQNLHYVQEHQSKQDFDLVNKIIDTSMGKCNTLHISFKHSTHAGYKQALDDYTNNTDIRIPGAPADFYEMYLKTHEIRKGLDQEPTTIFANSYQGEEQVHAPILREEARKQAYVDLRMQFSKPKCSTSVASDELVENQSSAENVAGKSILRNKDAVKKESHVLNGNPERSNKTISNRKKKKKPAATVNENEYMSAYYTVMNDVVERNITQPEPEPEPLPQVRYVDAHAPRKRISRFKQMRAAADNEDTEKTNSPQNS